MAFLSVFREPRIETRPVSDDHWSSEDHSRHARRLDRQSSGLLTEPPEDARQARAQLRDAHARLAESRRHHAELAARVERLRGCIDESDRLEREAKAAEARIAPFHAAWLAARPGAEADEAQRNLDAARRQAAEARRAADDSRRLADEAQLAYTPLANELRWHSDDPERRAIETAAKEVVLTCPELAALKAAALAARKAYLEALAPLHAASRGSGLDLLGSLHLIEKADLSQLCDARDGTRWGDWLERLKADPEAPL